VGVWLLVLAPPCCLCSSRLHMRCAQLAARHGRCTLAVPSTPPACMHMTLCTPIMPIAHATLPLHMHIHTACWYPRPPTAPTRAAMGNHPAQHVETTVCVLLPPPPAQTQPTVPLLPLSTKGMLCGRVSCARHTRRPTSCRHPARPRASGVWHAAKQPATLLLAGSHRLCHRRKGMMRYSA
jgi:hypothetical protein